MTDWSRLKATFAMDAGNRIREARSLGKQYHSSGQSIDYLKRVCQSEGFSAEETQEAVKAYEGR